MVVAAAIASAAAFTFGNIAFHEWRASRADVSGYVSQRDAEKIELLKRLAGTSSVSEQEKRAVLDALSHGENSAPLPSEEDRVKILEALGERH
jgi:inactivated superfamily I helicase